MIRNGIEIIKDANIVLLETGEFIEIALTWGNVTNFAGVVNDGKKLTDITHGTEEGVDWVVWNNKGSNSVQFPLIDYGFNSGDPNVWYHPVIPVWWILDKIQEENGVTFNFPADRINFINRMIVPLLSNNDSQELYDKYPSFLNVDGYNSVANSISYLKLSYTGDSTQTNFAEVSGYYNSDLYVKWDTDLRIIGDVSFSVTYNIGTDYYNKELRLHVKEIDSLGSVVVKNTIIKKTKGAYIESSLIKLVFNFDENIHVDLGQYIDIVYQSADISTINYSALSLYFSARGEVLFGEKLPLVPNLPDVKQIDFIKAIASMVGLFALPDGVNGIKFIPFDNLSANKFKAVDWTNRVIMAYRSVTPRSLKYTLDNIAQNNRFQYKEDDKVKGDYDGNIQVNDATIDYERDAIKLPFSACDAKNGVAYIPMYSYNENGELQYNKTNPRILLLDGTKGVFKGLEWTTLIANNYQTYKGLINDAKVVTEYIRLNSIELRDLEMDVPVYLAQYGCYLAIIEIKTNENDICECKLLKL